MSSKKLFAVALCLWACSTSLQAQSEKTKPQIRNVLWIIADDLNTSLGCYGDPLAKSPNIDALAKRGARFERAYCTFPLCGPSRNSMLTGLYPNSTGIQQNSQIFRQSIPKHQSLPQHLRLNGFMAGRIGKLYHYNVPNSVGTNGHDDPASWELEINPAGAERLIEHPQIHSLVPKQFGATLSWLASDSPEHLHTDAIQAEDANWVLDRCAQKPQRPFFLAVGFFRPHTPYVAPKSYFDLHDPNAMKIIQNVDKDRDDIPKAALASGKKEQDEMDLKTTREALQAYYASVSFMDAQVGKIIAKLDALGLSQSTAIVFTSDHGYHLGEHGLWQKMSLFEQSSRVPLLLIMPGITQPGSVIQTPVSQIDLYPTLCQATATPVPSNLQGQSLIKIVQDTKETGRGWALTQVTRGNNKDKRFFGYSIRTQQYRYTEWDSGDQGIELYDHEKDPMEINNLAKLDSPEIVKTKDGLRQLLHQAIQSSLPADGKIPEVGPMNWAPNLTDHD